MSVKCPNKNSDEWRQLVDVAGGDTPAYAAWIRNGEDIPTAEQYAELLRESEEEATLNPVDWENFGAWIDALPAPETRPEPAYQLPSSEGIIASEKTIREVALRMVERIGMKVAFETDRTKNYKGRLVESNFAVVNLAHATLDTPIHEILGHPVLAAIKQSNPELYSRLVAEMKRSDAGRAVLDRVRQTYRARVESNAHIKTEMTPHGERHYIQINRHGYNEYLSITTHPLNTVVQNVYETKEEAQAFIDQHMSKPYTAEEHDDEALVELVGLLAADKLNKVKEGRLISLLKRLFKEMNSAIRSLLTEKEVEVAKLPDTITVGDLANLFAYSNSKLILPGYEVQYTTPDNKKFSTYTEASQYISQLAVNESVADLSSVDVFSNAVGKADPITGKIIKDTRFEPGSDSSFDTLSNPDVFVVTFEDGTRVDVTEHELDNIEDPAVKKFYYDNMDQRENMIEAFMMQNSEFEFSRDVIEEWKDVNNIVYNPEEVYALGQGFYSVVGAYSEFDVELMFQNLLQHIDDNRDAGGEFAVSAFTRPINDKLYHIEGNGGKIRFAIYPQSEDILWAAKADVYSGSVWDAAKKINKSKASELLGVSYTKYPAQYNLNHVVPTLADAIHHIDHAHNELGISLVGDNFRMEYDDDIPRSTKKLLDSINSILDERYGKLEKPTYGDPNKADLSAPVEMKAGHFVFSNYGGHDGTQREMVAEFDTREEVEEWMEFHQSELDVERARELGVDPPYSYGSEAAIKQEPGNSVKEPISEVAQRYKVEPHSDTIAQMGNVANDLKERIAQGETDLITSLEATERLIANLEKRKKAGDPKLRQALVNRRVAALKEGIRKYPRSFIRSEVRPYVPPGTEPDRTNELIEEFMGEDDLPFQLVPAPTRVDLDQTAIQDKHGLVTVYHGSDMPIGTFRKPGSEGYQQNTSDTDQGIYFTLNKDEAKDYGAFTNPSHLLMRNPYYWYGPNRLPGLFNPLSISAEQITQLQELGHDGIVMKAAPGDFTVSGENDYLVVFEPEQVFATTDIPTIAEAPYALATDNEQVLNEISRYRKTLNNMNFDRGTGGLLIDIPKDADTIGRHLFGKDWALLSQDKHPTLRWDDQMQPAIWDSVKGDYLTYLEYWNQATDTYTSNRVLLEELGYKIEHTTFLEDTSNADLMDLYSKLMTTMGPLEKSKFGMVFWRIGNEIGDRKNASQLARLGLNQDLIQSDINKVQVYIQSIADFGTEQAAMQGISLKIGEAATRTKIEYFEMQQLLDYHMTRIMELHYALQPQNLRQKTIGRFFNGANQANEAFLWLFAKDAGTGKYLGRFVDGSKVKAEYLQLRSTKPGTTEAKLAEAKWSFYQFINKKGNEYLAYSGRVGTSVQAFMPQTSMDVYEEYSRNGMHAAWMKLFGEEYMEAMGPIQITSKGVTKTVDEWRRDLTDPSQPFWDKVKSPMRLNRILAEANKKIRSGNAGIAGHLVSMEQRSFSNSSEVPMRYLQDKEDFSINAHKLLTSFFKHAVFKKHHDPLVTELQAIHAHYEYYKHRGGEEFKNNIQFIELYANRYLFGEKDWFQKSVLGRAIERLNLMTVLSFLGASPATSMYNVAVGTIQAYQSKIAKDGWKGVQKMNRGYTRLLGVKDGKFSNPFRKSWPLWAQKAAAIMEYYQIETFSKPDIEQHSDQLKNVQDKIMWLQSRSESFIRGVSFLAELTEEQWEAFEIDSNGLLQVDTAKAPSTGEVNQIMYNINKVQGDYSVEYRRNYHSVGIARMAMLFKGWMPDYFQERLRTKWTDRDGVTREGYYTTVVQLIPAYRRVLAHWRGKPSLEPYEVQNLRKILFDVAMWTMLSIAAGLHDDDDEEGFNKLSGQLFLMLHPRNMLKMVVQPFPSMYMADKMLMIMEKTINGEVAEAGADAAKLLPGNKVVSLTMEALEDE